MTGKEPEVKRLLDAQERAFLPERRNVSSQYFSLARSHAGETFVELQGKDGRTFHVRRVVEDFIAFDRPLREVLATLAYFHDEMSDVQKEGKALPRGTKEVK